MANVLVWAAGGTVQLPPTDMGPMIGVLAFVIDTEGNRIGIRQPSEQPHP